MATSEDRTIYHDSGYDFEEGYDDDQNDSDIGVVRAYEEPKYHFVVGERVRFALDPQAHGALMPDEHVSPDDELIVRKVWYSPKGSTTGEMVRVERTSDGWCGRDLGWDSSYFVPYDSEEPTEWQPVEEEVLPLEWDGPSEYD